MNNKGGDALYRLLSPHLGFEWSDYAEQVHTSPTCRLVQETETADNDADFWD